MTIENVVAPVFGTPYTVWANLLNTSFSAMDSHTHSENDGVIIDTQIINFNGDFSCNILTDFNAYYFAAGTSTTACSVLSDGLDLIAYDGIGREIYITRDGVLNSGAIQGGGFIGDYIPYGAMCVFTSGNNTYSFENGSSAFSILSAGIVNSTNFLFSQMMTCINFTVAVSASNSILFSLPGTAAGLATLSSTSVWATLPYLTCSASSTIASQAALGTNFFSLLTDSTIHCTLTFNSTPKANYYFNQAKTTAKRTNQSYVTVPLTYPVSGLIPFVECANMLAAPIVTYSGSNAQLLYFDYRNSSYTVESVDTIPMVYNGKLAYQATYLHP